MIYTQFKELQLSKLGFGTMRLPLKEDKTIDKEQVKRMVKIAIDNGVNYFDTAWPYHDGQSEIVIGKILKDFPRDSYYIATKYPGHQQFDEFHPEEIFEKQLKKVGVDYFDFYLLHNVSENSEDVYRNPKWGIIDYFIKQKELGRIKHLGFSCHGKPDCLEKFLKDYHDKLEFCQIQLNYLDYSLQDAKSKIEILNKYNMPIWVMEPVRGGKLAKLSDAQENILKNLKPNDSIASWGFNWLKNIKGVSVILSGMSNEEQMLDNIKTFKNDIGTTEDENIILYEIAEQIKNAVPCTKCRYCTEGCPQSLDIPSLIETYNDLNMIFSYTPVQQMEVLPKEKWPHNCIGCGACKQICPQGIDIPTIMNKFAKLLDESPKWADICKQRNAIANNNK